METKPRIPHANKNRRWPAWPALEIVGIYALVGFLWIVFSDAFMRWLFRDPAVLVKVEIFKGLFYVAATAGLLYILIHRQVWKYQRTENALRESEKSLLEEIHERQQTEEFLRSSKEMLKRKSEQLQEADKRKNEFLAMLAHELRNPLSLIRTTSELLRLNNRDHDQNVVHWVEVLNRQVIHLARIVDDLLDTSRISRGLIALKKECVDLADSVAQAVEITREMVQNRRQQLEIVLPEEPLVLTADPVRVVQIIYNLVNNASKFTGEEGVIRVAVRKEGGKAVIAVSDNGIGIAPENLANVFDLFYQEDKSLDRAQGGLGLGLTLVKWLTTLHGGTVAAFSNGLTQGSRFEIRLPLQPVQAPASQPSAPPAKILVVEANPDSAESLTEVLKAWNYQVWLSAGGDQTLQLAREIRPDLVLIDIRQSGRHGYQLCADMKAEDAALATAVHRALVSEHDGEGQRAGCDRFLSKPVRMQDLEQELKKVLAASQEKSRAFSG